MGVGKNDSAILILFPNFGEKLIIEVLNLYVLLKKCVVSLQLMIPYQSTLVSTNNNYGPDQIA